LAAEGQTQPQIAKVVNVHRSTIARWVAREDFQQAVSQFRRDVKDGASEATREVARSNAEEFSSLLAENALLALKVNNRQLRAALDEETEISPHRSVPAAALSGKWFGLEDPSTRVESQLDRLQRSMSADAFKELLSALAEGSD